MKPVAPFAPNAGREGFFETDGVREGLRRLSEAMGDREPFLMVTGEPGCGKTALVREAVARWGEAVRAAWLSCRARTDAELVEEVVRRLGAEPPEGASVPRLVACFEQALGEIAARQQLAVIVVDDAHALETGMLEELRLLVNAAQRAGHRIEVLLVGLPALAARLEEPALATLRQRVSVRCGLEPFSAADTLRYLHHRVSVAGGDGPGLFARKSCREIATHAHGLPRQINTLAAEALRLARAAEQPTVCSDHVRAAAASLWGRELPAEPEPAPASGAPSRSAAAAPGVDRVAEAPAPVAPSTWHAPQAPQVAHHAPAPSAPPAPSARAAPPASAAPLASATPAGPAAPPVPPAPQDPSEWVKRFMGDQGPVQIGSRAAPTTRWGADDSDARVVPRATSAVRQRTASVGESSARLQPSAPSPPPAPPTSASPDTPSRRATRVPMLVPALVALTLVCAVGLLVRAGSTLRPTHASARQVAARPEGAPSTAPAQGVPAVPVVAPVGSRAASAAEPGAGPEADSPAANSAATTQGSRLTLDVGAYLDPERAGSERERLRAATGLDAWVTKVSEAGGHTYHVVLGIYRSSARADAAADLLLTEGRVSQVRVVPLPPRRARR